MDQGMETTNSPRTNSVCVVSDPALRKRLQRVLTAAGCQVSFYSSLHEADEVAEQTHLLFIDRESRLRNGFEPFASRLPSESKIVVIGESLEDDSFIEFMRDWKLNHCLGDASESEEELQITTQKLVSGDVFGLEKYLGWAADVQEFRVSNYAEKRKALEAVSEFAQRVGARRRVRDRIENAVDELLMNAIYDAPAAALAEDGETDLSFDVGSRAKPENLSPATLRFACDGRTFGVAVIDRYGRLNKEAILNSLLRARRAKGAPKEAVSGGAGLGIYFVLSSANRLIANIQADVKSEAICLFDLKSGRSLSNCAESLHIFHADPAVQQQAG